MFSRKTNNSWMMMSSAMLGGFLLGLSYKKYGKEITNRIGSMAGNLTRRNSDYEDYMTSHEPDA